MNSKGHLTLSFVKSGLRIIGCIVAYCGLGIKGLCAFFALAEFLGVAEELVDKR